jgi:membrane protease YdiL (CAAX protease family)
MDWRTWALRRDQYPIMQRRTPWRSILKAFFSFSVFTVIISLIAGLAALIFGVGLVTPYILDTGYNYDLFLVIPIFVTLANLSGNVLLAYYFAIVAAIVASCAWVFLTSYKGFFKELTVKAKPREHSPIFDISGLVFVNVFITLVIVFIAVILGAGDTQDPVEGDLEEMLFALANASVWEEVIVRILMIGLPLLVIDLIRRKPKMRWHSYILGGKFEIGIPEVILVIVSATIFGYAHFLGDWGFWKVPAAAIGGIAFGYLFLRHGLASAIVMHFVIDYAGMPSQVFGYTGVIETILILIWLGLGLVFTVYYLTRIGEFLTGQKYLEDGPPQLIPTPVPQPWGYQSAYVQQQQQNQYGQYGAQQPPYAPTQPVEPGRAYYGGYVCPNCGSTEARWINGQFQCLRCGKLT